MLILAGNQTKLFRALSPGSFKNLTNLVELNLNRTSIDSLYKDGFESLKNLTKLDLSNNYIDHINEGAWNGMTNLRELNLSKNILKYLPSHRFLGLENLTVLDLSQTQVSRVGDRLLSGLKNLQKLRISGNLMFSVSRSAFDPDQKLEQLQFLDLSYNNLGNMLIDMDSDFFGSLPNLEELDLRHNIINELKDDHFANNTKLRAVHLSSANLKRLGDNVFYWSSLEYLDLAHNNLESLPKFPSPKLRFLDLAGNRLTTIEPNAFSTLNLNYLDLSSNRLTMISSDAFSNLAKVRKLNLANNGRSLFNRGLNISSVREAVIGWMDLEDLDLSSCSVKDSDLQNEPFRNLEYKLKKLDLSKNELTQIPALTKFQYMKELDFSNNKIKQYKSFLHQGGILIRI